MKLYVDDWREAPDRSWTVVRSISSAIRFLVNEDVEELSLDHDPALISKHTEKAADEQYTSLAWIIRLLPLDRLPRRVYVHSGNVFAADKVESILNGLPIKIIPCAPLPD